VFLRGTPFTSVATLAEISLQRIFRSEFSSSNSLLKKSHNRKEAVGESVLPEGTANPSAYAEAFDFIKLENSILKALEHLTHSLAELRSGSRFNTDQLERLKIQLKTGESLTIQDVAQVVVKGRFVNVILSDEEVCYTI
jgi:hypothetical protein